MKYSKAFYDSVTSRAALAADMASEHLCRAINFRSIIDIGCGEGIWLKTFAEKSSAAELVAVDLPGSTFKGLASIKSKIECIATDLANTTQLPNRIFDLVICVEVIEHVSKEYMVALLDYVTKHSIFLLFSGAVPGQGGTHHVNEQPMTYWHKQLASRGFVQMDIVRPLLMQQNGVPFYYQNNVFLYFNPDARGLKELSIDWPVLLSASMICARDIRSRGQRILNFTVRWFPAVVVTKGVELKDKLTSGTLLRMIYRKD